MQINIICGWISLKKQELRNKMPESGQWGFQASLQSSEDINYQEIDIQDVDSNLTIRHISPSILTSPIPTR